MKKTDQLRDMYTEPELKEKNRTTARPRSTIWQKSGVDSEARNT